MKAFFQLTRCLLVLLSTASVFSCSESNDLSSYDLVITSGQIIDPVSGSISIPKDIFIGAGEIQLIVDEGEIQPSPDTRIQDAAGLFLSPGLIDVHAHIGHGGIVENTQQDREQALQQFLRYGVTSIFVPGGGGGNDEQLAEWKQRCGSGELACPRIYGSGNIITAHGSHPITTIWGFPPDMDPAVVHERGATGVKESDDVQPLIDHKARIGVDALKIVVEDGPGHFAPKPRLGREKIEEICTSAHEQGLKVFAHVSLAAHVDDVVAAGCDGIMHAPDDLLSEQTLQSMAASGFYYVATLSLMDALMDQDAGIRTQEDYATSGVSPKALESLTNENYWSITPEDSEIINEWKHALGENLRRVDELGIPIALGSDTNNPQIFPGYAAHEELALLTDAGLSELRALQAATITAAAFLEQSDELGQIAPGFKADILGLKNNPLEKIRNSRSIEFVIANGELVHGVVAENHLQ